MLGLKFEEVCNQVTYSSAGNQIKPRPKLGCGTPHFVVSVSLAQRNFVSASVELPSSPKPPLRPQRKYKVNKVFCYCVISWFRVTNIVIFKRFVQDCASAHDVLTSSEDIAQNSARNLEGNEKICSLKGSALVALHMYKIKAVTRDTLKTRTSN